MLTADFKEQTRCSNFAVPEPGIVPPRATWNDLSVFPQSWKRRKTSILLVEDDDDIRSMTRIFLETAGYEVWGCSDGLRATHVHARVGRVDLLISDIQMPFVTGTELAQALTTRQPSLRVLLTSGVKLTARRRQLVSRNGWSFLQKPCPIHVLIETIDQLAFAGGNVLRAKPSA